MVDGKVLTLSNELGLVEGQEFLLQVVVVSGAVGAALQGADFVVDPFEGAGRECVVVPVEETSAMGAVGLGHREYLLDAAGFGAAAPGVDELLSSCLRLLVAWGVCRLVRLNGCN